MILVFLTLFILLIWYVNRSIKKQQNASAIEVKEVDCRPHEWESFENVVGEGDYILLSKLKNILLVSEHTIIPRLMESLICKKCGYVSGSDGWHLQKDKLLAALNILLSPYRTNLNQEEEYLAMIKFFEYLEEQSKEK